MSVNRRVDEFCRRFGIQVPILLAPMAGVPAPALSIAVGNAGGMASCGALLFQPDEIHKWTEEVRAGTQGPVHINLWVPDPPPVRDARHEAALRNFLAKFGPEPSAEAADATPPDFGAQCEAVLGVAPAVVSSIMGLFPASFVQKAKAKNIAWFATATTLSEALAAEAAGADAIIAQGVEAGGHRGAFDASAAERDLVGLFSLVPAIADAVKIPVVAAGGIADGRGIAAAIALGASAVAIGTGFLRSPEANIAQSWADAIGRTAPEGTIVTRAFSGRPGRSILTEYVKAATAPDAPNPAPYPVQRALTAAMRKAATQANDIERIQAWAGQSSKLARAASAADITRALWEETREILRSFGSGEL